MAKPRLVLNDGDLREIFALFSSPSDDELHQVYDQTNSHFYEREDLGEEYSLTQEKREFADDVWRAATYFLFKRGFTLTKGEIEYDLCASSGYASEIK